MRTRVGASRETLSDAPAVPKRDENRGKETGVGQGAVSPHSELRLMVRLSGHGRVNSWGRNFGFRVTFSSGVIFLVGVWPLDLFCDFSEQEFNETSLTLQSAGESDDEEAEAARGGDRK